MKRPSENYIDHLLKKYSLNNLNLICKCKSALEDLCTQECGETALHCQNKKCNYSNMKHKTCRVIKFEGFKELLENRLGSYAAFFRNIQKVEKEFIRRMRKERKQMFSQIVFREFQEEQMSTIQDIFLRKNIQSINGGNIDRIIKKLRQQKEFDQENQLLVEKYSEDLQDLQIDISQYREKFLRYKQDHPDLNESIILVDQQNQKKTFILDCLNKPKEIELIFRASQHRFSSAKFYQHCDKIQNVLVLVKTQFGKIFGGFSGIGWNSQLEGNYSTDWKKRSCLFTFGLEKAVYFLNKEFVVYNSLSYGPNFSIRHQSGRIGQIVCLQDRCNKFPSNVGFKNNPLIPGTNDKKVLINEYQVFQVRY